jgi:hypothetical protein
VLREFGLHHQLGLTISERSSLKLGEGQGYLEKCVQERRAAVITVAEQAELDSDSVIPTVWVLSALREL